MLTKKIVSNKNDSKTALVKFVRDWFKWITDSSLHNGKQIRTVFPWTEWQDNKFVLRGFPENQIKRVRDPRDWDLPDLLILYNLLKDGELGPVQYSDSPEV